MALSVAKNCTRVGLAGGAVYWSVQQGVWGGPQEGYVAMKRLSEAIIPSPEQVKREKAMRDQDMISNAWNAGTKVVFDTLIDAPQTVGNYANNAGTAVSKFVSDNITGK